MLLSLKQQLLTLEDDFLSALSQGEAAIVAFERRWQSLFGEIDLASGTDDIDADVLTLAHTTAVRCATLADISIETFSSCETAGAELVEQLDSMMSELSIDSYIHPSRSSRKSTPIRQSQSPDRDFHDMSPTVTVPVSLKRRREECSDVPRETRGVSKRSRGTSSPRRSATTSTSWFPIQSPPPHPSDNFSTASIPSFVSVVGTEASRHLQRKRRASDADLLPTPCTGQKRLRVGPRLHAVSDSYPAPVPKTSWNEHPTAGVSYTAYLSAKDTSLAILDPSVQLDIQPFLGLPSSLASSPFESLSPLDATERPFPPILPELGGLDAFLKTLLDPPLCQNVDSSPFSDVHTSSTDASECSLFWPQSTSSQHSLPSTPSSSSTPSLPATPPSDCLWNLDGSDGCASDRLRKPPPDSGILFASDAGGSPSPRTENFNSHGSELAFLPNNAFGGAVVSSWPSLFDCGEAVVSFPIPSHYFLPFDVNVFEDWEAPSPSLLPVTSS